MSSLGSYQGISPIGFESVSNVTATNSVQLGTRAIVNGEEYVYFYNATGSLCTQGMALTVSGLSGYSLTRSTTAAADMVVCFAKHNDVAAGSYAWGLVRGVVQAYFSSTMATGTLITIGDQGVVQTYVGGSFPTGPLLGKVLSSATNGATGLCYVKCFG